MNIKDARIMHGLTIKQVSEITGVPYRSLQNWEAGVRSCPDYVSNMIVRMINDRFKPNYELYLEVFLEVIKGDFENAASEELKEYIKGNIKVIESYLTK